MDVKKYEVGKWVYTWYKDKKHLGGIVDVLSCKTCVLGIKAARKMSCITGIVTFKVGLTCTRHSIYNTKSKRYLTEWASTMKLFTVPREFCIMGDIWA